MRFTDTNVPIATLELQHRRRARAEGRTRAALATGLRNLPLHNTAQSQIWLKIVQFEKLLDLLPYARWYIWDSEITASQAGSKPSAHLPLQLRALAEEPETVEGFIGALDDTPATVRWDFSGWPPAPEIGLGGGGPGGLL